MLMMRRTSPRGVQTNTTMRYQYDHALIQQADRDVSIFAVGLPQIGRGEVMSRENLAGSCEV